MAKTIIACKDSALEVLAGPGDYRNLMEYYSMRYGVWDSTTDQAAIQRLINQESGRLDVAGVTFGIRIDQYRLTIDTLVAMINDAETNDAKSLDVYRYPAFVAIPEANYGDNVPNYLPNSTTQEYDPDNNPIGDPVPVPWSEWKDATHEHRLVDGVWNIPLNSNNNSYYCSGYIIGRMTIQGLYDVQWMIDYPSADDVNPVFDGEDPNDAFNDGTKTSNAFKG